MIIVLSIIALIIAIIVLAIKYVRTNAKELSKKTFEEEARKKAEALKYVDPVITCDYCGSSVDTGKYKTCPNCGGSYSDDKEWQRRHATNFDWADLNADKLAEKKLKEAKKKNARTVKKLKKAIIALAVIIIGLIALGILTDSMYSGHTYAENEKLNEYSFDHYIETSHGIDGSKAILDHNGVKAEITGIYQNKDDYSTEYKIGYRVSNGMDQPVCVKFERCGVNGFSNESSNLFYEWIKAGDTVTLYDRIYDIDDDGINSLVYTEIGYHDDENLTYGKEGFVTFKTTEKRTFKHTLPDGDVVFDKNNIKVINAGFEESGYTIWIENSTDNNYVVKTSNYRINSENYDSYGIYKGTIPAGHIFKSDYIYSFDTDLAAYGPSDDIEISIEFKCPEDPSKDFSTGYFRLN